MLVPLTLIRDSRRCYNITTSKTEFGFSLLRLPAKCLKHKIYPRELVVSIQSLHTVSCVPSAAPKKTAEEQESSGVGSGSVRLEARP